MHSMPLKQQLFLAFGVLAAALLIVGSLSVRNLGQANESFAGYVDGVAARERLATTIRIKANRRALAVRDMVLVKSPADREAAKAIAGGANTDLHKQLGALKASLAVGEGVSPRERARFAALEMVEAQYEPVALAIVGLAASDRRDEAIDKINTECRPLLASLISAAGDYIDSSREQAQAVVAASAVEYATQRLRLIALSALAILAAVGLGWSVTRRLVASLGAEPGDLIEAARRVAHGDLAPIPGAAVAPTASVLASMGAMQAQLVTLIGQVRSSADSIATASTQIAQGNGDLSVRSEEQASALQQTAASMDQLGSTVKQNAESARQADRLAANASEVAIDGGQVVGRVVETMKGINDSSRKIADIIGVIDSIAFQTNILALNAAVEAARAGEEGRGFAVVASEVRSLAGRSASAAREIKDLIGDSVDRVEQGSSLVEQAGRKMTEVVASIRRVTDIVGEISTASQEQSTGVARIGESVTRIDQATQRTAALVEESAAAAESMKEQAQQLVQAVSIFRGHAGAPQAQLAIRGARVAA